MPGPLPRPCACTTAQFDRCTSRDKRAAFDDGRRTRPSPRYRRSGGQRVMCLSLFRHHFVFVYGMIFAPHALHLCLALRSLWTAEARHSVLVPSWRNADTLTLCCAASGRFVSPLRMIVTQHGGCALAGHHTAFASAAGALGNVGVKSICRACLEDCSTARQPGAPHFAIPAGRAHSISHSTGPMWPVRPPILLSSCV